VAAVLARAGRAEEETVKHCVDDIAFTIQIGNVEENLFKLITGIRFPGTLIIRRIVWHQNDVVCTAEVCVAFGIAADIQRPRLNAGFGQRNRIVVDPFCAPYLQLVAVCIGPYAEGKARKPRLIGLVERVVKAQEFRILLRRQYRSFDGVPVYAVFRQVEQHA